MQAISGAVLICEDTGVTLGTTNRNGLVRIVVKEKSSPGKVADGGRIEIIKQP